MCACHAKTGEHENEAIASKVNKRYKAYGIRSIEFHLRSTFTWTHSGTTAEWYHTDNYDSVYKNAKTWFP
jgi:hypothetical protein